MDFYTTVEKELFKLPPSGNPHFLFCFKGQFVNIKSPGEEVLLPKNYACGQAVRCIESYHNGIGMLGIMFKPDTFHHLLREDMQPFTHQPYPIEDVLGNVGRDLNERLHCTSDYDEMIIYVENALRKIIPDKRNKSGYLIHNAISLIDRHPERSIDEICKELRSSGRHLRRIFKEKVGIGPKYYLRIKRLHKAASMAFISQIKDFQQIVHECGYYDQSHFGRDIKLFTGKTPLEFFLRESEASPEKMIHNLDHLYKME